MRTRTIIFITFFIFFASKSVAQTKYLQTFKGEIIDTLTYADLKAKRIDKLKRDFPSQEVNIKEDFKEIRRTSDSIVCTYKWTISVGDPNVPETNGESFNPKEFIGKHLPFASLKTIDDRTINLTDLKGKPTLINFWFVTCIPCIAEMPVLSNIQSRLKDSVNFIAITYEPKDKVINFLKTHDFTFNHISDARAFIGSMNMNVFPVNIFLDKDGIVRKIEMGGPIVKDANGQLVIGDGKEFEMILRELL